MYIEENSIFYKKFSYSTLFEFLMHLHRIIIYFV